MYINGTIYMIIYCLDPSIIYVGSTFDKLKYRWQNHKTGYKQYLKEKNSEFAIYPYFKQYGMENFKMIKIKDYIVYAENKKDHKHLSVYEQLWINKLKCVNKVSAFNPLSKFEQKIKQKEVTARYRDKIKSNETEEEKAERKEKDKIRSAIKLLKVERSAHCSVQQSCEGHQDVDLNIFETSIIAPACLGHF